MESCPYSHSTPSALSSGPGSESPVQITISSLDHHHTLRRAEQRVILDIEGLRRLLMRSVYLSPADAIDFYTSQRVDPNLPSESEPLFLNTVHPQFVACIPPRLYLPSYYADASKLSIMVHFRSSRPPVPRGYTVTTDQSPVACFGERGTWNVTVGEY